MTPAALPGERHDDDAADMEAEGSVVLGWSPADLDPSVQVALAVPVSTSQLMTRWLFMDLLTAKLDALIQADPRAARAAMEMSQDQYPELYAIIMYCNMDDWAGAIVRGDRLAKILAGADWAGVVEAYEEQSLLAVLEVIG